MLLVKKLEFFSLFVFSQKRTRNKVEFSTSQNGIFPKGLTHAFGQKLQFFPLFVFGQKKTRNNAK